MPGPSSPSSPARRLAVPMVVLLLTACGEEPVGVHEVRVTASMETIHLGEVSYTAPITVTVALTNDGTEPIRLENARFEGASADLFTVLSGAGVSRLEPGDTFDVVLGLTGDISLWATGSFTADLLIDADVLVQGTGCRSDEWTPLGAPIAWSAPVSADLVCDLDEDGVDAEACLGGDCDDEDEKTFPNSPEACDGVDNDCNGEIDDDPLNGQRYFPDDDGDGFGDLDGEIRACTPEAGYVREGGDCDDDDPDLNPGAAEVCDGLDNDCDGVADSPDPLDGTSWWPDLDGDGWGASGGERVVCEPLPGWVEVGGDCDDAAAAVNPAGVEVCDDVDQDCDGAVDEEAVDASPWYTDADGDGWGDPGVPVTGCEAPAGYVADATDCDDGAASVYPGADEWCDLLDNDCDGAIETEAGSWTFYADSDGDGFGDPGVAETGCAPSAGFVADASDCDDTDPTTFPGAEEICADGVDNDCDGALTGCASSLRDASAWFQGLLAGDLTGWTVTGAGDVDGDGHADLLIGAPGMTSRTRIPGGAFLVQGPVTGAVALVDATATILGLEDGDLTGTSLAALGDVNGDGAADFLVGAPGVDGLDADAGCAYLLPGPLAASHLVKESLALLGGQSAGDGAGSAVAAAGDVDGDGLPDLLVGAPYRSVVAAEAGAAYVVAGVPDGVVDLDLAAAVFLGTTAGDRAGSTVAGLGDLDGDGLADVGVGTPTSSASGVEAGGVAVLYGPLAGAYDVGSADGLLVAEADGSLAGSALTAAGDLDGDGYPDLLVGAPGLDGGAGAVYLVHGPAGGMASLGDAATRFLGEDAGDLAGSMVAAVGDQDGDGSVDVAAGAPGRDGSAGAVYVLATDLTGTVSLAEALVIFPGFAAGDALGPVTGPGDVDGDGLPDLLVGAPYATGVEDGAGAAWLLLQGAW